MEALDKSEKSATEKVDKALKSARVNIFCHLVLQLCSFVCFFNRNTVHIVN